MKKSVSLLILGILISCGSKTPVPDTLAAPSNLLASVDDQLCALLSWQDNCPDEKGYYLFLDGPGISQKMVTLPANTTSYKTQALQAGQDYAFSLQAFRNNGDLSLRVSFPAITATPAISLEWTEEAAPAGIRIYKTTSPLNGRSFNAWYAVADCTGDVRLRVLFPGDQTLKTLDEQAQAQDKCLLLINGGIFSSKFLRPIGFALYDGQQTPWRISEDEDQLRLDREYWGADSKLHPVSRGLFGVDRDGVPGVYWSFTPEHGRVFVYDKPIPSTAGEQICKEGSATYPDTPVDWEPCNALTCGPVLLKDGKCPISAEKTTRGYWKTNYELWADDIYGVNRQADRTAVGYLPDGRIILLVADGRITASQGATTLEMAAIMRGLGCVGALNLDGGGSTGMWVKGRGHINDLTGGNRPLMITLGFFSK